MSLVQIATETVTSAVGYVDLIGTTTDDIYMIAFNNVQPSTDATQLICRVLVNGNPDTSAEYDRAGRQFRTHTSVGTFAGQNETFTYLGGAQSGTNTSETNQGNVYLYNFNNSNEFSFATFETITTDYAQRSYGLKAGFIQTELQACNGLRIYFSSGNIASGTFTLYRQVSS